MYTKKIYVSGGSFHELQEVFQHVRGVVQAIAGYINPEQENPSYEAVRKGQQNAVFGVEVAFNPKKIDLSSIFDILFTVVNPYVKDKQGDCEGRMYRSGIYYTAAEDEPMIEYYLNFLHNRRKAPAATESQLIVNDPNSDPVGARRCYAEAARLNSFVPAEEEQQNYLARHPGEKTHIDFALLRKLEVIS